MSALSNVSKKVATNVARPNTMIQECSARVNAAAQMQAVAAAHVAQRVGTMTVNTPVSSLTVRATVGGSMSATGALQQYSKDLGNGVYEVCAYSGIYCGCAYSCVHVFGGVRCFHSCSIFVSFLPLSFVPCPRRRSLLTDVVFARLVSGSPS